MNGKRASMCCCFDNRQSPSWSNSPRAASTASHPEGPRHGPPTGTDEGPNLGVASVRVKVTPLMTRVPLLVPREDGRVIPESGDLARRAAGDLSALDRRTFLRLLGAAAGAGLLPAACTREPAGVRAPSGLRHLSRRGWAVLNAAATRIAGPEGAKLVAAGVVDPALGADRFLDGAPALVEPLGQALLVVEYAVWPLSPKLRPFTSLAPEAQDAVLSDLAGSRLETKRRIFGGVRAMALLGFYAAPEARALTGYPIGASHPDATIADAMTYPLDE